MTRNRFLEEYSADCTFSPSLERLFDKWSPCVVSSLAERPHRFGELHRRVQGISQKMLTSSLHDLERDGFVLREVLPTGRVTVEYSLTSLGGQLATLIATLCAWTQEHADDVIAARERFDRRQEDEDGGMG